MGKLYEYIILIIISIIITILIIPIRCYCGQSEIESHLADLMASFVRTSSYE